MSNRPIINCHTHIFTGDHVPPFLAKKFVPPPFHFLLPLTSVVRFFRWWYNGPATARYTSWYKKLQRFYTRIVAFFNSLYPFNIIVSYYIFFYTLFLLCDMLRPGLQLDNNWLTIKLKTVYRSLSPFFPLVINFWARIAILVIVLLNFEAIRNFIFFIARFFFKAISKLPGKHTKEIFSRYLNIGRYAFHKEQDTIFSKLKGQYPDDTKFVVLPMDMDYMKAGDSKNPYRSQMEKLAVLKHNHKENICPFVFADPRRFVEIQKEDRSYKDDLPYFKWEGKNGKVELQDCFIKQYLEGFGFDGIKIYPALGYYPFDEKLLPLWKYAADNEIPIMTHCIRGTIFYRGQKKKECFERKFYSRKKREHLI